MAVTTVTTSLPPHKLLIIGCPSVNELRQINWMP